MLQPAAYACRVRDTAVSNPFFGILPSNRTRDRATVARRNCRQYPLFPNITNNTMPWPAIATIAANESGTSASRRRSAVGELT